MSLVTAADIFSGNETISRLEMITDGGDEVVSTWGFRVLTAVVLGVGTAFKYLMAPRRDRKLDIGEDRGDV